MIEADLDAYWIDKFGVARLTAEIAGVRHARRMRAERLNASCDAVALRQELARAVSYSDNAKVRVKQAEEELTALRKQLTKVNLCAEKIGRERENLALERVDLAAEVKSKHAREVRIQEACALAESAQDDTEAREKAVKALLARAKEGLRLREARHTQRVTALAGEAERVRGEWESLRDENRRVLREKRAQIAAKRDALLRARAVWADAKHELDSMIDQEAHKKGRLKNIRVEIDRWNNRICSILDTVVK